MIFLSPFVGYSLSSILNNHVHIRLGQRGVAIIGPSCHLISYIIIALHPPYPVLVVMFVFVGFGNGLLDAAWCAWLGNMANANEVQGILQACYALGATVAPLITTGLISSGGLGWYSFYYIMVRLNFPVPETPLSSLKKRIFYHYACKVKDSFCENFSFYFETSFTSFVIFRGCSLIVFHSKILMKFLPENMR